MAPKPELKPSITISICKHRLNSEKGASSLYYYRQWSPNVHHARLIVIVNHSKFPLVLQIPCDK
jgi:hypothetical protein